MENNSAQRKVLIVDDDRDIAELIQGYLMAKEFSVAVAKDGVDALHQVQVFSPELIVADLSMPNLNGWQFCQKLRENEKYKKVPVIVLSALVDKEGPADTHEAGDYYMGKPIDFDKLFQKIQELLPRQL